MEKLFRFRHLLVAATLGLSLAACEKDKDADPNANPAESEADFKAASQAVMATDKAAFDAFAQSSITDGAFSKDLITGCATVDISPLIPWNQFPKTITIDFGTEQDCQDPDGQYRKGKIITVLSALPRSLDASKTTTFQGYAVGEIGLEGSVQSTFGLNEQEQAEYVLKVVDFLISTPSGNFEHGSDRVATWVEGDDTPFQPWDDAYSLTGTATGSHPNGIRYATTIQTPLLYKVECQEYVSGSMLVTLSDGRSFTVDFGDGACDGSATLSSGAWSTELEF